MIWLLLGLLLFGGSVADPFRPQDRVLLVAAEIESVVEDAERCAAARAIADGMVQQAQAGGAYRAAFDAVCDEVDAAEQRLLVMNLELRDTVTADEWRALIAPLCVDE